MLYADPFKVHMYVRIYIPNLKSKNLLLVGINTLPAMYCISKLYTIVGCLDMSGADVLCWLNNKNNTEQTRMLLITFGYIQPLLYYIIGACSIIMPTEPQHYTVHCIFLITMSHVHALYGALHIVQGNNMPRSWSA